MLPIQDQPTKLGNFIIPRIQKTSRKSNLTYLQWTLEVHGISKNLQINLNLTFFIKLKFIRLLLHPKKIESFNKSSTNGMFKTKTENKNRRSETLMRCCVAEKFSKKRKENGKEYHGFESIWISSSKSRLTPSSPEKEKKKRVNTVFECLGLQQALASAGRDVCLLTKALPP